MVYKSRRIVPQHRKRVWVGRGRCQAAIIPVNTGVPRVRKTLGPRRMSRSTRRSLGLINLPRVRKTAGPKRIRIRKNFGAGMPVTEIEDMIPNLEDITNFQSKIDAELNDDQFREEVIQNKVDAQISRDAISNILKQTKAASSEHEKMASLESLKEELFNKERAQHKIDTGRINSELNALSRAAQKAYEDNPEEYTNTQKEIAKLTIKKNNMINRKMIAESEIKKMNEERSYKNALKAARQFEQELEDIKEREARIAKKLNPFGKIEIAPLVSDFGFGKIDFGKFW